MAIDHRLAFVLSASLALCPPPAAGPQSQKTSALFAQAAQNRIDSDFPSESISYLLLDASSGSVIAERWSKLAQPIPIGSLIKPFTALAYAKAHRQFPAVVCSGQSDSCWLPHGHGRLTISQAVAQSCNAYFLQLAHEVSVDQANETLASFDLPQVNNVNKNAALSGLSSDWRVSPLSLVRAYAALARESHALNPEIFAGMQASASTGTARAIAVAFPEHSALAKTGTAQCTHAPRGSADGFTVILYPADDPRVVLLVRKHGVTGAATAATAAQMLRTLEGGQP